MVLGVTAYALGVEYWRVAMSIVLALSATEDFIR